MISITDPIQPALDHTKRILFQPFSWEKWFVLGFCAFLAHLGGGGSFNYNSAFDRTRLAREGHLGEWAAAHLPLVILLGALLLVLVLGLVVLFQWLGSRGTFMFLDGVARNRAAVVEPWDRFRTRGNQVFRFRLLLLLVTLGFLAVVAGAGFLVVLPALRAEAPGRSAFLPLLMMGGILVVGLLALLAVSLLLKDFVVPIMYRRDLALGEAWAALRHELLPGNGWPFLGFYLMSLVLWIPAALLAIAIICLTCCVALLPYLSSVALLPISVFFRCYSLCFLEQFGEDWRILEPAEPGEPST
ncbi:MAG TPA: hypothetical protein VF804_14855 [Holophagaceae bacterium]